MRDLTGTSWGQLIVLEYAGSRGSARARPHWVCACDCGGTVEVSSSNLVTGGVKSCGCRRRAVGDRSRTHGDGSMANRLYRIWRGMLGRCETTKDERKRRLYADRGITVCAEWHDYANFRAWALGNGYEAHLTIDRRDNDLGYAPSNCRWATKSEQAFNRRPRERRAA